MAERNPDNKFQELLDLYDQIIASGAPEEEVEAAFLEEASQGGLGSFNNMDELRRAGMSAYQVGTGVGSQLAAGAESFAQDALFGFTDELAGAVTGLLPGGMNREEGTEAYRARLQGQREQFPKTTFAGSLAGMLYGGGKFVKGAKQFPGIGKTIRRGVDERTLLPRLPGLSKDPRIGGILTDVPLMAADLGLYNVGKTEGSLPERLESTARSAQGLLDQYGAGPVALGSAALSTATRRLPLLGGARKGLLGTPDEGVVVARRLDELLESPDIIGRSRRMTDGAFDEVDNFFNPENFDVLSKGSFSKTTGKFIPKSGTAVQRKQLEAVEELSDWMLANRINIEDVWQKGSRGASIKRILAQLDARSSIRQGASPTLPLMKDRAKLERLTKELDALESLPAIVRSQIPTNLNFIKIKPPQGYPKRFIQEDGTIWATRDGKPVHSQRQILEPDLDAERKIRDTWNDKKKGDLQRIDKEIAALPRIERTEWVLTDAAKNQNSKIEQALKEADEAYTAATSKRNDDIASLKREVGATNTEMSRIQKEADDAWAANYEKVYEPTLFRPDDVVELRNAFKVRNMDKQIDELGGHMEAAYSNMTTRAGVIPADGAFATANRQFALGSQLEQAYDMGFSLKGGSLGVGGGGAGQIAFKAKDVMTPDGLRRILDQIASSPLGKDNAKELQEAFLQGVWQRNVIGELRASKTPEIFNVMQRSTKEGQEFLRLFFPEGRAGQQAFEQARLVIIDNVPPAMKATLLQRIVGGVASGFAHRLGGKGVGG
tara:strand:+ start:3244 stop:5571 length:2328 start_codon:yes stop_codon:yes gene_type:complete